LLHSAYIRLENYRNDHVVENPSAFLVRTAINIAVDMHRHEKLLELGTDGEGARRTDEAPLQDEIIAARERLIRVNEGLAKLPPRTREIFLLHRLEGLKNREIAARFGISQSAVEKHVSRATLFLIEWTQDW
jgi:RNA polymerase sigma-70 factor (ECF subfamily)